MQLLFSKNRDPFLSENHIPKIFEQSIQNSFNLYLFQLYLIQYICKQAKNLADKIQNKYIPSEDDKNFVPALYDNDLIQSLVKNKKLQKLFEKNDFKNCLDEDVLKKIYGEFSKEEWYKKYSDKNTTDRDHLEALLELYRFLRKHTLFNEIVEDHLYNWEDDNSLIIGAIKKTLKSLPASEEFYKEYMLTETETLEFGRDLLNRTIELDEDLSNIIKPTLKNWDSDRVAVVDMILLKMAITEFLSFDTIPTNATLNEYVELSKVYSTPKSKEFVNGVLDKIMKDLLAKNLIKKSGRGLSQEK
ncbi:MAG: transcription antitermination factor NusB [Saprospiraceae bacterium]